MLIDAKGDDAVDVITPSKEAEYSSLPVEMLIDAETMLLTYLRRQKKPNTYSSLPDESNTIENVDSSEIQTNIVKGKTNFKSIILKMLKKVKSPQETALVKTNASNSVGNPEIKDVTTKKMSKLRRMWAGFMRLRKNSVSPSFDQLLVTATDVKCQSSPWI